METELCPSLPPLQVLLCEGPLPVKFVTEIEIGDDAAIDGGLSDEWKQRLRAWNGPSGRQGSENRKRAPEKS